MQNFKMSASEYLRCAPKYTISRLNNQNFSGEGTQTPPPAGRGHPLPHPTPSAPSAPHFSRLRRSPPPLKNPGYALAGGRYQLQCSSIALVLARLVYCDSVLFGHATSSRDSSLFRTLMHGLSSDPKARAFYGGLHYQAHWHRFYTAMHSMNKVWRQTRLQLQTKLRLYQTIYCPFCCMVWRCGHFCRRIYGSWRPFTCVANV